MTSSRSERRWICRLAFVATLTSAFVLFVAASASAKPIWEGGQVNCRPSEQVRLVVSYRGVLDIEWSEAGGLRHESGPYYSALLTTLEYDTGASEVAWRAEAKPGNDTIPGDIDSARHVCVDDR